jgi:hypothetical protein
MSSDVIEPLQQLYEMEQLGWLKRKAGEGMALLKKEDVYNGTQQAIDYVNGQQLPMDRTNKALSVLVDNKVKKIALEIASALTDVRPIWNYTTYDNSAEMKHQAEVLNKLARSWWRNSRADRQLFSAIIYALCGGSSYMLLTYDGSRPAGGDLALTVYDPRDVIPIDPVYSEDIQEWRGIILRRQLPPDTLKTMYPAKAHKIEADATMGWFGAETRKGIKGGNLASTVWQVLRGRMSDSMDRPTQLIDYMTIYLKDDSIHTGSEPRLMGEPDKNWSYMVYPIGSRHPSDGHTVTREEARLYPRGRLILCTPTTILRDIPNPHWHGNFPVIRICLDSLPFSLSGSSIIQDIIPLQNTLNEVIRGAEDGIGQWIDRGIIADKNVISKTNLDALDTRRRGLRAHINPSAGQGFTVMDGPTFPNWYIEMPNFLKMEIEENSGVRGLQQLSQLKQMPAADTVEKFMDALSPLLKQRARSIELSLSDLAELLKVGFYQFYDAPRRLQILGKDGLTVEDFDYDPSSMVPVDVLGNTREERARNHYRNFTFQIAPNSFLDVSNATKKMLNLQLFREGGAIDIYTLWEGMDMPNIGTIPAETLPDRIVAARKLGLQPGPTPEVAEAMAKAQYWQATAMAAQFQAQSQVGQMGPTMGPGGPQGGPGDPAGPGAPPPPGPGGGGPGRPPSGQELPQPVMKDGGTRMVISESGR